MPKNKDYPEHKNIIAEFLPFEKVFPPLIFNLLILPKLFALYREHKFQILRIHSSYFVGPAGLFFKKIFPKVKLITTYHHLEKKPIFNLLDKLLIRKWDKIITVSQATKKDLIKKFSLKPSKINIVLNGLDPQIKPQKKDKNLVKKLKLSGKITLLYLGQLTRRKNVEFLLKVIQKLSPDFRLLIVGNGSLKSSLMEDAAQKKLKNKIFFTGFIQRGKKVKYLNLCDLFLYPSKKEGFGLSVLEAMACGKPVICSDIPALREIVKNQKNGFLLNTNKVKDWVFLIKKLAKSKETRDKIGERAQKVKHKFSWSKTAQATIKVYQNQLK